MGARGCLLYPFILYRFFTLLFQTIGLRYLELILCELIWVGEVDEQMRRNGAAEAWSFAMRTVDSTPIPGPDVAFLAAIPSLCAPKERGPLYPAFTRNQMVPNWELLLLGNLSCLIRPTVHSKSCRFEQLQYPMSQCPSYLEIYVDFSLGFVHRLRLEAEEESEAFRWISMLNAAHRIGAEVDLLQCFSAAMMPLEAQ